MSTEEVVVSIAPDGTVSVQVSGFKGMSCRDATASLEALLGNQVLDRVMTDEAFQEAKTDDHLNLRQDW